MQGELDDIIDQLSTHYQTESLKQNDSFSQ
jgi:protein subunit release factor A